MSDSNLEERHGDGQHSSTVLSPPLNYTGKGEYFVL
jgi:hypothetical protein